MAHLGLSRDLLSELGVVFLRTIILYIVALIVMRLAGKRTLGKMDTFDFVVTISIGSAVAIGMEADNRLLPSIAPVVMLGVLQWVLTRINLQSPGLERMTRGSPITLVQHGKVRDEALSQERMTREDLLMQLRQSGKDHLADVETAILEPTGKVSVIPTPGAAPLTASDIQSIAQAVVEALHSSEPSSGSGGRSGHTKKTAKGGRQKGRSHSGR